MRYFHYDRSWLFTGFWGGLSSRGDLQPGDFPQKILNLEKLRASLQVAVSRNSRSRWVWQMMERWHHRNQKFHLFNQLLVLFLVLSLQQRNKYPPGNDHIYPGYLSKALLSRWWFSQLPVFWWDMYSSVPWRVYTPSKNELSSWPCFPPIFPQASKPKAQPVAWGSIRCQEDYTTRCNKGNPVKDPFWSNQEIPCFCLHPDISKPMTDPWYWYIDVLYNIPLNQPCMSNACRQICIF